jgi:hypothetical protein
MINLNPEGRYYQTHRMARNRIPMLPWWLVGWFVGPLLACKRRRDGDLTKESGGRHDVKGDGELPF